jgi:hypothetical protein
MVEILGVLAIMGVLSIGSIWAFSGVMNRFRTNDLLEEASARAMRVSEQIKKGRKTLSLGKFLHNETMGGTFSKKVFTDGLHQQFAIQVSDVNKSVCERVLNSITDNSPLRRLSLATSPTTPLTECQDGNAFLMVYNSGIKGKNKDKKYCESDKDCDTVCGECNEKHICHNECEIPLPDNEAEFGQECGENECIVYDEETQSCKYACQRVEYLESTGSQYIDTEIYFNNSAHTYGWDIEAQAINSGYNSYNWITGYFQNGVNSCGTYGDYVSQYTFYPAGKYYQNGILISTPSGGDKYTPVKNTISLKDKICDYSIILFARTSSTSNTIESGGVKRVFTAKYYDNDALVRDFIPVIAPDGEACMFDKVSKKLFCNAGSGTFKTNLDE